MSQSAKRIWVKLGVTGALAIAIASGAISCGSLRHARLAEAAIAAARRPVLAFAEAASAWANSGRTSEISDVADLMLSGTFTYVTIHTDEGQILVRSQSLDEGPLLGLTSAAERTTCELVGSGRHWTVHVSTPWEGMQDAGGFVRVGVNADGYAGRWIAARWQIAVVGFFGWVLLSTLSLAVISRTSRRAVPSCEPDPLKGIDVLIDAPSCTVEVRGTPVRLQPKAFALLCLLSSEEGRVFSEGEIIEHVWPDSPYANASDIRQCIYKARRTLNEAKPGAGRCIVTEKGFGYRFVSRLASFDPDATSSVSRQSASETA